MKLLALAMFLAVIEAAPPIPRQAADNPAQTTTNVKSKSAPDQAEPLPSLASVKRDSSGPTKADSGEQRPEDAQHTIGISKLPPVTITKDWADWGVWVFSGLLVAVGFLQVWLLYGTLKAIQRQAGIMQDNINLIINKERMRISAQVLPLNLPPAKEGAEYEECAITCVVRFEGPRSEEH